VFRIRDIQYVFCLLFEGTFTSFFTDKKVIKKSQSRFFLLFLLDDARIQVRIRTSDGEAQKLTDPEHWYIFLPAWSEGIEKEFNVSSN
jgi:hypothetical protein